jgi:hypothetical protein
VPLAAFAVAGLGIHLLPSADPRMTLPLVPVLVWLIVVATDEFARSRRSLGA